MLTSISGWTQAHIKGQWSEVIGLPLVPAAAANLPDGKVLLWSARDRFSFGGNAGRTYTIIFDPATQQSNELLVSNTQHDMFCSGTANLPDGRIMVTGGSSSPKTSIYNPLSGQWTSGPDMNIARAYHAMVTLSYGDVFIVGGSWNGGRGNKHAEVFQNNSWNRLPGVPVDFVLDGATDPRGVYANDNHVWLWPAPNGKIIHVGPAANMHWVDVRNGGSYTDAGARGDDGYAICGNTVMYDIGKILKVGGAGTYANRTPAFDRAYIIDVTTDNALVEKVESMKYGRVFLNSVVAPNGQVFAFGGNDVSHAFSDRGFETRKFPERFDPVSKTWTLMEPMKVPRNYHSIALLLLDGRIMTGGGGLCGGCTTNHPDVEIFSPPYLFDNNGQLAVRPTLRSVPSTTGYDTSIPVETDSPIASFALVRASSVTHGTNNEQRRIPLNFRDQGGNDYAVNIPGANLLPPGDYMLFASNANGVPSVAKIINISSDHCQNVALNKPVSASSIYTRSGVPYGPAYAVDGKTGGDFFKNNNTSIVVDSVFHTQNNNHAWWEVDLGKPYDLAKIKIWTRADCCTNRLTNFHVLVSETPFISKDLTATINQQGVTNIHYPGTPGAKTELAINGSGRYVRIQLAGSNFLQLAEVELLACGVSDLSFRSKMILEGSYDMGTSLMKDALRQNGHLPNQDPFGLGSMMKADLLNNTGNTAIVDWVKIAIHDASNPQDILAEKACLLLRNGEIIDDQGKKELVFAGTEAGTYFVVIHHGNHLGLSTATAVDLSVSKVIDFTNPGVAVLGGQNAGTLKNNLRMLCSGDANGDGVINAIDKNLFWRPENGSLYQYGTSKSDFNQDGIINAVDKNLHWQKNNSKFQFLPK